jgi:Flp pilus assembly protein CpaB
MRVLGIAALMIGLVSAMAAGLIMVMEPRLAAERVKRGWVLAPAAVAAREVPAGTVLTAADFEVRSIPEQFLSDNTYRDTAGLAGKRVYVKLSRGTPIAASVIGEGCAR